MSTQTKWLLGILGALIVVNWVLPDRKSVV